MTGAHPALTVILVVGFVILAVVAAIIVNAAQNPTNPCCPGETPIGSALAVENPIRSVCGAGDTFVANGCAAGDFRYDITIESSTVAFGGIGCEVVTAAGNVEGDSGGRGFTFLNVTGVVIAQYAASGGVMSTGSSAWTYSGATSASSPVISTDEIVLDIGPSSPAGLGLTFVVFGVGSYTGTTSPLTLP